MYQNLFKQQLSDQLNQTPQQLTSLLQHKEGELFSSTATAEEAAFHAKFSAQEDCQSRQSTPVSVCNGLASDTGGNSTVVIDDSPNINGHHAFVATSNHPLTSAHLMSSGSIDHRHKLVLNRSGALNSEDSEEFVEEVDDDELMQSDSEDEHGGSSNGLNGNGSGSGNNSNSQQRRKKKTRTVFTRSQV